MAKFFVFILLFSEILSNILGIDYSLLDANQPKPTETLQVIQNISLESLYLTPGIERHDIFKFVSLSKNCTLAFETLCDSLVNFTRCSITYSRPIRICMKCGNEYKAIEKNYESLKNNQGAECQEYFFSGDQLAVVDIVYNGAMQLWEKSLCDNCYDHLSDTEEFFTAFQNLQTCIQNPNNSSAVNGTCIECGSIFANLSSAYHNFISNKEVFEGGICMDIVDAMNSSRKIWSELKCVTAFESKIGFLNILTALTVGATPVMFYLLAKNVSRLEDIKLVRPKRKSTTIPPTTNHH